MLAPMEWQRHLRWNVRFGSLADITAAMELGPLCAKTGRLRPTKPLKSVPF